MTRTVLALDLSSVATGWAVGTIGGRPASGEHRFAPKGSIDDEIWYAALKWMTDMMKVHNPDVVAIEAAIMASAPTDGEGNPIRNPRTAGQLWGLQAVIRTVVMAIRPSPARLVNVASARKFFTGRGTYPKGEAKPAVQRRCIDIGWLDIGSASDGRADACCIYAKACADLDPAFAASFTALGTARRQPVREEVS